MNVQINRSWFWKIPALVGVLGALGYFGFDLIRYRPALAYELEEVIETIGVLRQVVYNRECKEILHEWYEAKELETSYIRREESIPEWLIDRLIDLAAEKIEFGCEKPR